MPRAASKTSTFRYRLVVLLSMAIILPLGYWVRFSGGPAPEWFNDAFGSIAYEILWILLVLLIVPTASPRWTAMGVCLATCGLEFLQLWTPPFLQALRSTFLGRLILGNTFNWADFLAYFAGSFLGWVWLQGLQHLKLTARR